MAQIAGDHVKVGDKERTKGPRSYRTYRRFRRSNSLRWKGVEPDRVIEHPPLVKMVSKRGEVYYRELW